MTAIRGGPVRAAIACSPPVLPRPHPFRPPLLPERRTEASSALEGAHRTGRDGGMSTAEYAIGTVSAVAFAAVLYAILTSSEVRETLTRIVVDALQSVG